LHPKDVAVNQATRTFWATCRRHFQLSKSISALSAAAYWRHYLPSGTSHLPEFSKICNHFAHHVSAVAARSSVDQADSANPSSSIEMTLLTHLQPQSGAELATLPPESLLLLPTAVTKPPAAPKSVEALPTIRATINEDRAVRSESEDACQKSRSIIQQ
jgi:hypothetical protein